MRTVNSKTLSTLLALVAVAAGGMLFSCKNPLFGLGGRWTPALHRFQSIHLAATSTSGAP